MSEESAHTVIRIWNFLVEEDIEDVYMMIVVEVVGWELRTIKLLEEKLGNQMERKRVFSSERHDFHFIVQDKNEMETMRLPECFGRSRTFLVTYRHPIDGKVAYHRLDHFIRLRRDLTEEEKVRAPCLIMGAEGSDEKGFLSDLVLKNHRCGDEELDIGDLEGFVQETKCPFQPIRDEGGVERMMAKAEGTSHGAVQEDAISLLPMVQQ